MFLLVLRDAIGTAAHRNAADSSIIVRTVRISIFARNDTRAPEIFTIYIKSKTLQKPCKRRKNALNRNRVFAGVSAVSVA